MKTIKKIFITLGVIWMMVVFIAHYVGIIGGIERFHPSAIERIMRFFS